MWRKLSRREKPPCPPPAAPAGYFDNNETNFFQRPGGGYVDAQRELPLSRVSIYADSNVPRYQAPCYQQQGVSRPSDANMYPPRQSGGWNGQTYGPGSSPAGQGPYPAQGPYCPYDPGPYPNRGYYPQQRETKVGYFEALLAALACCCCLDMLI